MTKLDTETQSSIRTAVRRELDEPDVFDSWFKDISVKQEDDDHIEICLRNETQARYFRERFGTVLRRAVKQELGGEVSLAIHGEPEGDTEFSTSPARNEEGAEAAPSAQPTGNGEATNQLPESNTKQSSPTEQETNQPNGSSRAGKDTNGRGGHNTLPGNELSLRQDYRFEQFVVGPCNRLAHAAALAVLEEPGRAYNPLFIHGPVGLGKSHLLQALCHAIIEDDDRPQNARNVLYLPCEKFVNLYINGIQEQSIGSLRDRLRDVDLLVIDDVHFLANKSGSQEEFFHTFNELYNSHSQIVLSSDCPPGELASIEERLMSRFKWGLTARLEEPSWETALAIVKRKFDVIGDRVDDEIQEYIARISSSIREMEGAVSAVSAAAEFEGDDGLSLDDVKQLLGQSGTVTRTQSVTVRSIQKTVGNFFDVDVEEITSDDQSKQVANARHVALYLSKRLTNHSLSEIGSFFGEKNHSSVHYAVKKIEERMEEEQQFQREIDHLKEQLQGPS